MNKQEMGKAAIGTYPEATINGRRDAVHIVSQKKGGIGKSTVARILAEYLKDKHGRCLCFDTDPSQPTFQRVAALEVRRVQLLNDREEVDAMLINPMLEAIVGESGPFVIDTGSSSYHALWSYIVGADLFGLLQTKDRPVVVHVPLAPKPDLEDTLTGFDEIAEHCPPRSVVVWSTEREAPIHFDGCDFTDLKVAEKHQEKILASVVNIQQRQRWNRQYVGAMLAQHQTFAEALQGGTMITQSYLKRVRDEVFGQLAEAGL